MEFCNEYIKAKFDRKLESFVFKKKGLNLKKD